MVRLVFWIDTKAGIGQSTFRQNDGHHEKEEKESKKYGFDNQSQNSNQGHQLVIFQDEKEAKKQNKEKQKDGEGNPKVVTEVDPNKYNFKRKELSPDDQIRVLHEAYQFLLKKHKLGEDPKAVASLVSPFMKLEMEPKVVTVKDEPIQLNIMSKDDQDEEEEEVNDEKILELEKAIEETSKTERKGSLKRKKSSKSSTKTAPKKKSLKAQLYHQFSTF